MDVFRFQRAEKREAKLLLKKRLPARKRYAAAAEIGAVSFQLFEQFPHARPYALLIERFRIVAERAAQIAARKEDDAAQPLSVHAGAAIYGVDISLFAM